MKAITANIGYFFKETFTILKLNKLSNILSLLSITLAFFLLSLVVSTWLISTEMVEVLQQEAEINVFLSEEADDSSRYEMAESFLEIEGIQASRVVTEAEALERMENILGEESEVLTYFDENPFESFVEVKVDFEQVETVKESVSAYEDVRYVRDHQEVLDQIRNISALQRFLGTLFIVAAGTATLVIISHIIRQGIYHNRQQINTLLLLGAPNFFVALPFVLSGLVLTLAGGLVASLLTRFTVGLGYAQLVTPIPFIPLPPQELLVRNTTALILGLSIFLGLSGSIMGIRSSRKEESL